MKVNDFELHPEEQGLDANLKINRSRSVGAAGMFTKDEVLHEDAYFATPDPVNHPSHYTHYKGLEVIQLTEQMNYNRGNVVKYVARAGLKSQDNEIEDLEKAKWYIQREIDRLKGLT